MNRDEMVLLKVLALALVLALLAWTAPATAVDDLGIFELDGNATQDMTPPLDEWSVLYAGGGSPVVFTGIMDDSVPATDRIFVGGRKDIQDISDWGWKYGSVPDKDQITHAYAAAYLYQGDLIVVFGCDRYANNGDAFLAFWFFQDKVGMQSDGSFGGHHTVGDILVLVNYPQASNAVPEIEVIEWNPAEADIAPNLKRLFNGVVCGGSSGGESLACATTNDADMPSPWPYTPKDGTANVFPFESFYEGGINLSEILGSTPCFGSFMAESRSSERFSATLKDFSVGDFPLCAISVSKSCDVVRLAEVGDPAYFVASFDGKVTNIGAGGFPAGSVLTIVDDAGTPGDASDDVVVQDTLASSLESGGELPFSGEFFTNENPPTNTVRASIAFGGSTIAADPFSVECTGLDLNPSLSLSKLCWNRLESVSGGLLAVKTHFSGEVCNDGDVPLTVSVTDNLAGTVLSSILMEPGDCMPLEGSYLPSEADGGETDPCLAEFSDTFTAVGTSPIPGVEDQTEKITANCPLCDCQP